MSRTRNLMLCLTVGFAGLVLEGCKSAPLPSDQGEVAAGPAPVSQQPSSAGRVEEVSAEPNSDEASSAPYSDRAAPFSEERVQALESQLKSIDNIPISGEGSSSKKVQKNLVKEL